MDKSIIQEIWPEWTPEERIGRGEYGEVYKCVNKSLSPSAYAAIKVIAVPKDDNAVTELKAAGLDDGAVKVYFEKIVKDCVDEIMLLESLKGAPNIVSVEDYTVRERDDPFGWIICIRMEMLDNLPHYLAGKTLTEDDVICMGIDICTALETCHTRHIIHRDIKPSNIMVSPSGVYKLGDFGIARNLEKSSGALSNKGNLAYKAPEVENRENYDMRVDIYSLGLTMYQLLNNGRPPFVDPQKSVVSYEEREEAIRRRYLGETFPQAANASDGLTKVLNKACAFDPAKRYGSATIMKQALTALQKGEENNMDNPRYPNGAGSSGSAPNNASSGGWNEAERNERRSTVHGGYNGSYAGGRQNGPDDFDRTMVAGSGFGSAPQERGGQTPNRQNDWNRNAGSGSARNGGYDNDRAPHHRGEMPPDFVEPPMPRDNLQDSYLSDLNTQGVDKKKVTALGVIAAILILGLAAVSVILGMQLKEEKDKNDDDTSFCILAQPESIKTVDGETVCFVVEAKGDELNYQWEQKEGGSWKKIKEDGDSRVLELEASDDLDDTEYRCKVTNEKTDNDEDDDDDDDGETEHLYTKTVKLTLGEGIKITEQPKDAKAVLGEEVSFTVAAEADDADSDEDDITYQWEKLVDGVWESIGSDYNEATFTFTPKEKHNGAEYRCRVTSADKVVVFSDSATVTVEP